MHFNLYDDYVPVSDEEKEAVGLGLGPSGRGGRRGAAEQEETTTPEVTEDIEEEVVLRKRKRPINYKNISDKEEEDISIVEIISHRNSYKWIRRD